MSDITVGSAWFNRCDGVEAVVVSVGNDCIGFTQTVCGKKCFYSHTVEEFKEYYEPKAKADMVNNPPHYKDASGVECIEVTKHMQFCGGNCFKYLYRAGKKGSTVEDLKKAAWYAERAWIMSDLVNEAAIRNIRTVAEFRTGFIQDAMIAISNNDWYRAEWFINEEVAMLGGCND